MIFPWAGQPRVQLYIQYTYFSIKMIDIRVISHFEKRLFYSNHLVIYLLSFFQIDCFILFKIFQLFWHALAASRKISSETAVYPFCTEKQKERGGGDNGASSNNGLPIPFQVENI